MLHMKCFLNPLRVCYIPHGPLPLNTSVCISEEEDILLYNQDSMFHSNIVPLSTFQFIFQFFQLAQ